MSMKRIPPTVALLTLLAFAAAPTAQGTLNTSPIDQALGRSGQMQGDVYRVSFPRTDLTVTVDGVRIRPGFALGSWGAFRSTGADAIAHGDLVLTEAEVDPVISKLFEGGLEITALHNHLLGETPRIMYLHFWGRGDAAKLAASHHAALALTATPAAAPAPAAGAAAATPVADPELKADVIQKVLGRTGTERGGVLSISIPRPEPITMMGVAMPPAMGMATAFNFQAAGAGNVAATGDFVMTGDEVNPVARALRQNGIGVRALHNHMIHGTPELYFMHFWAIGTPDKVASGLRAAADLLKK
jgi:hypothetical protein